MRPPGPSRRLCLSGLAALLPLGAAACAPPPARAVRVHEFMRMGPFSLRADSVSAYSRAHQGVPWEVEVLFSLEGGNRFDRAGFVEALSRRGLWFQTAAGWRDRVWLLRRGEDYRTLALHANPPSGSRGYVLEIDNPYGQPARFRLDLEA